MASIFSKIVSGEIPCHKIAETENCLAFLDVFPLAHGHVLIVPKKEIDYIFDVDDELFVEMHLFSKKVARVIKQEIPCKRIGVAVVGLEVPHAHIHLIPLHNDAINFSQTKLNPGPDELKMVADKISAAYNSAQ
ncbi:MAG TPA: HIT family protein [Bacteroidia bacterium]|nr:HIT family protein [Bacteroidia bacterium]